jgi:spore coat polysaccharide biosynthesis predicted glycosyltransferase SpsG
MTPDVLFLAECGPEYGMGHLSRSLVLADALRARGASVRFALTTADCVAHARGFPVALMEDAAPTNDVLIVDGYRITEAMMAPFAARAGLTVLIDDLANRPKPSDVLVNYQFYAETRDYGAYPAPARILGPRYFPIRPGLYELRTRNDRAAPRPLLTFGGGATGAFGFEVARALAARFGGAVDLAVGAMAPPDQALPPNVTLHRNVDFVPLMARATLYVGALGTSVVEAVAAGLPVAGVVMARDQEPAVDALRALGATIVGALDADALAETVAALLHAPAAPALPAFPDGDGAGRLADALLRLAANPA